MTFSTAQVKCFKLKPDASQADNFEIPWQGAHQLRHCKISTAVPRSSALFGGRDNPDYLGIQTQPEEYTNIYSLLLVQLLEQKYCA
jgi:hypothetical protein